MILLLTGAVVEFIRVVLQVARACTDRSLFIWQGCNSGEGFKFLQNPINPVGRDATGRQVPDPALATTGPQVHPASCTPTLSPPGRTPSNSRGARSVFLPRRSTDCCR